MERDRGTRGQGRTGTPGVPLSPRGVNLLGGGNACEHQDHLFALQLRRGITICAAVKRLPKTAPSSAAHCRLSPGTGPAGSVPVSQGPGDTGHGGSPWLGAVPAAHGGFPRAEGSLGSGKSWSVAPSAGCEPGRSAPALAGKGRDKGPWRKGRLRRAVQGRPGLLGTVGGCSHSRQAPCPAGRAGSAGGRAG